MTVDDLISERVAAVRGFNRFFTRRIGVLREGLLHSPYSLTEARIIFELGDRRATTASELGQALGLDGGYLSRVLARFEQQGLIEKVKSTEDGRQRLINLTEQGQGAFQLLDRRSADEVGELLGELGEEEQQQLLQSMRTITAILDKQSFKFAEPFFLRQHQPGDMGWVTHRHGLLYFREYGWNEEFEALVAQITADFINHYQPMKERCWIAEMNGEIVGSIMLVCVSETVAKLRLLLVEPKARGLGLGTRLVEECIRFARRAGYQKLTLWTNSVLVEARHIYAKCGFRLVSDEPNHSFGHDLTSETWELML